jgi:aromatic ring-opening dioxygenase catalytic subunit (LigB family)
MPAPPSAILVISGHWEERDFTVMSSPAPGMIYDYSGFPEFTYSIRYPAPGAPGIAGTVEQLLQKAGLGAASDDQRGFDHGTFAPLAAMYPEADVPVIQLSIRADYDVTAHLRAGAALAPLRREGVMILASGLSYHNLRQFGPSGREDSSAFDSWLTDVLTGTTGEERNRLLREWTAGPASRWAHPREDHLIPLMVAVGAAQEEPGSRIYHEDSFFGALAVSSYRFGS